jgi:ABC-2 type transport system permease protein
MGRAGVESLAWVAVFALAPISAVYYPVDVLGAWLRPVALSLPTTHVFEGMRAVLFENTFRYDLFGYAVALNALYMVASAAFFLAMFRSARARGLILQQGE